MIVKPGRGGVSYMYQEIKPGQFPSLAEVAPTNGTLAFL